MNFLKIDKLVFDLAKVDTIDLYYDSPLEKPVVRIQMSNRRDELVTVKDEFGRPVIKHIKHGVYEIPGEWADKFRWFINTLGPQLGIVDVEERYANKAIIERIMADAKAKRDAALQLPTERSEV